MSRATWGISEGPYLFGNVYVYTVIIYEPFQKIIVCDFFSVLAGRT